MNGQRPVLCPDGDAASSMTWIQVQVRDFIPGPNNAKDSRRAFLFKWSYFPLWMGSYPFLWLRINIPIPWNKTTTGKARRWPGEPWDRAQERRRSRGQDTRPACLSVSVGRARICVNTRERGVLFAILNNSFTL